MVRMIIDILLIAGIFFTAVGVIGVLRMPDVYGRLQASTCIATLGTLCSVLAGVIYALVEGHDAATFVKLALILLLVFATNPISNHALCKAAHKLGIKPSKELVMDDYKEDDPA